MANEIINCVQRDYIEGKVNEGFTKIDCDDVWDIFEEIDSYERCDELEKDESILQLIPYFVLTTGLYHNGAGRVLVYNRGGDGGEGRLADNHSVGIGGHWRYSEGIFECIAREAFEECGENETLKEYLKDATIEPSGFLLDNSNPVGRVHLGILFQLDDVPAFNLCGEIKDYDWLTVSECKMKPNIENWSALALNNLRKK